MSHYREEKAGACQQLITACDNQHFVISGVNYKRHFYVTDIGVLMEIYHPSETFLDTGSVSTVE